MDEQIKKILKNPARLFISLGHREFFNWMDDALYLKIAYRITMKKKLDLENPKTYNEKLQWLKLHDRNPLYTTLVDKYEVRKYIAAVIGDEYLIPLVGGPWNSFEEIDFDKLPDQFVLKCTHNSGGQVVCRDKSKLDIEKARKKLSTCLKHSFYWGGREWPYKNVKPRIIAEQYMEDTPDDALTDYKFFCFDGVARVMYISKECGVKPGADFFDINFRHLTLQSDQPNAEVTPEKPSAFEKMRSISEILAKDKKHLRVDFYFVDKKVYVGELTFFHNSGFTPLKPQEWEYRLGEWIQLPTDLSQS